MSSMNCSRNDVVLLPIPFSDLTSRKVRPAIVIGKQRSDVFVVPISSQPANTDWHLQEWSAAGLNVPCGVKAQVATVEEQRVIKIVGKLQLRDVETLNAHLRTWLQL
jgi:PemK-like, MazF-like toxin of type II toxin-antitoxin system